MSESFRTDLPPVAADLPVVADLLAAMEQHPEPPVGDVVALRADNARRLGGPLIRRPVVGTSTEYVQAGGITGEWISVPNGSPRPVFLYFSGGAYVRCTLMQGRPMASTLAANAHGRTFAVEYGCAPERPFPAPIDDGVAAYRYLLALGIDPHDIVLAGDSCGGSIIVSTMLVLRDAGLPLPAAGISIAPWADLTVPGPEHSSTPFMRSVAALYVGAANPRDPLLSPVFADLGGLPPLRIIDGTNDFLFPDALALARAAHRAGVDVSLHAYTGMPHDFPMFTFATGDVALAEAADFALQAR